MKVKILEQVGQTGLRKVGTIVNVNDALGKHWLKNKWVENLDKPKPKKKKSTTKKD